MNNQEKNVDCIKIKNKEIILVGTAHISKESVELVEDVIARENPDTVGVELCEKRYTTILKKDKWEDTKITKIIKEGKTQLFLANLLIASFQKRIGKDLKIKPGAEMIQAIKAGEKASAQIALLDRDIQITLKRAWRKMKILEKAKLIYSLLTGLISPEKIEEELIEKIKEKDIMAQMMEEFGREVPSVKEVLINERDIYIANKILAAPGRKMVAVVGAGHIEGIKKYLNEEKDIEPLEEIPQGSRWVKYIAYIIPLVFLGIIIWGFINHKSVELTLTMLAYWFLINGVLSALGTMIAFGHPLTVLSAFIAAPFTSLNPTIGAGIVAGLVEAKLREPRVRDFQNLNEITNFSGFYKNRISRILLVAALANLGSSIGTFVALPYLISFI
ncbi:TraB/GumN family protein [Candidatus Parcubacteria bacterium]|nr:TraB/GumN family protein [Candidatus Parcubacteria bacterium]